MVKVKNASLLLKMQTSSSIKVKLFSLVGESGSGKTTIGRAIIGLNNITGGQIIYDGKVISNQPKDAELICKIQMIFQDPAASLNERATVNYIISEGLYNFKLYKDNADRLAKKLNK